MHTFVYMVCLYPYSVKHTLRYCQAGQESCSSKNKTSFVSGIIQINRVGILNRVVFIELVDKWKKEIKKK